MNDQQKAELACRLMERATGCVARMAGLIRHSRQRPANKLNRAMTALEHLLDMVDEEAPDAEWWPDYYKLTGQHMILTEEGWEPGEHAKYYLESDPKWEPLDEVNQPPAAVKDSLTTGNGGNSR